MDGVRAVGGGHKVGGVRFDPAGVGYYLRGKAPTDIPKQDPTADKDAVVKLLKVLEDAQMTGKDQTVRDLRDKLKDIREQLGDEKLRQILEQLKEERLRSWLELLKKLFPDLFPDTPSPSPSPQPSPGGGGGGG
ncbi:hypothetical protein BFW86_21640, partial [Pseudomonas fluorescens]